jgi:hypothetical protein
LFGARTQRAEDVVERNDVCVEVVATETEASAVDRATGGVRERIDAVEDVGIGAGCPPEWMARVPCGTEKGSRHSRAEAPAAVVRRRSHLALRDLDHRGRRGAESGLFSAARDVLPVERGIAGVEITPR